MVGARGGMVRWVWWGLGGMVRWVWWGLGGHGMVGARGAWLGRYGGG